MKSRFFASTFAVAPMWSHVCATTFDVPVATSMARHDGPLTLLRRSCLHVAPTPPDRNSHAWQGAPVAQGNLMETPRRIALAARQVDRAMMDSNQLSLDEAHRLARSLVKHVDAAGIRQAQTVDAASAEEVVFETEVDGIRCVLTRTHAPATGALTPRECEIARMIGAGLSDKAIAAVLEISRYTVSTHLRRMYAKLGVASRAALVARVLAGRGNR